ncbi:EF-hand domain-containing protein [Variovorax sp.]|uniref:EF-hand domain-containing protein n=1 Tax=Variovorax sp. TaxID=1871043 RepID=UPI002D78139D|nr:EF-hand domain-containing protein [Variovorax sp.]
MCGEVLLGLKLMQNILKPNVNIGGAGGSSTDARRQAMNLIDFERTPNGMSASVSAGAHASANATASAGAYASANAYSGASLGNYGGGSPSPQATMSREELGHALDKGAPHACSNAGSASSSPSPSPSPSSSSSSSSSATIERRFRRMDANRDGMVSQQEFRDFAASRASRGASGPYPPPSSAVPSGMPGYAAPSGPSGYPGANFSALDADRNHVISRGEARASPMLAARFNEIDMIRQTVPGGSEAPGSGYLNHQKLGAFHDFAAANGLSTAGIPG